MATFDIDLYLTAAGDVGCAGLGVRGTMTRSGDNYVLDNQNIGTSAEAVTMGDCATGNHFVVLKNGDATNFVTLYGDGASGTKAIAKVYPGQFACFLLLNGVTIGAKADTAGIILEKLIIENVTVGTLTTYNPQPPSAGYATAAVSVLATIGSTQINTSVSSTEAVTAAGAITAKPNTYSDWVTSWPDSTLTTGNCFGTYMQVNSDPTDAGSIADNTVAVTFATVPGLNGFALIPFNHAGQYNATSATAVTHNEAVVMTRKTI